MLEYITDIEEVINELIRVAGIKNIFIVTVSKYSLSAYLYFGVNYQALNIIKGPPLHDKITFEKIKYKYI